MSDILEHRVPLKDLQNTIVLIGATATTIYDMRYTAYKMGKTSVDRSFLRYTKFNHDLRGISARDPDFLFKWIFIELVIIKRALNLNEGSMLSKVE
ncbi:MAG: CHASE2 domain-containing protein [bacterium]